MRTFSLFSARAKLPVHIVYVILVLAAMGLSVPRLFMKNQPRTRANTIALGMGAKSLILAAYQLMTEHVRCCSKWASQKANLIINILEIIFWAAVLFLVIQANLSRCIGISCTLSWVVVALAVIISNLAIYLSVVCYFEYRRARCKSGSVEYVDGTETSEVLKQTTATEKPQ